MDSPVSLVSTSPVYYDRNLTRSRLNDSTLPKDDGADEKLPVDTGKLVYLNLFYQGVAAHFPWNVLLAGQEYFRLKLKGVEGAQNFLSHFTIIFMTVKYVCMLTALFSLRKYNPKWQVMGSIAGSSLAFLGLTVSCCTDSIEPYSFYLIILVLVGFASLSSAVFEAGIFNIIGQFPAKYTQAFIAGHGVGGVVVISINILAYFLAGDFSKASFSKIYFGISTGMMSLSLLFFLLIQVNPFYDHYNKIVEQVAIERAQSVQQDLEAVSDCSNIWATFREIKEIAIAIFISATIGYIIFPEFMFNTKSTKFGTPQATWFHKDMFVNAALFTANVADMVGKLLPLIPVLAFQTGPFIGLAISRIIVVPLYLFGNLQYPGYKLPFEPYLKSDLLFFMIVGISSMTASYLGTVSMMWAPARVKPKERPVAIAIIIVCGALGFALGSLLSFSGKYLLLEYSTKV